MLNNKLDSDAMTSMMKHSILIDKDILQINTEIIFCNCWKKKKNV